MDESLLQATFSSGVWLCCKSHEALLEDVCFQRLKAGDDNIYPHVILVSSQQMWLRDVLRHKISRPLRHILLTADDTDATTATARCGLHDIHILEVIVFTLLHPAFVILWEEVCWWTYLEVFTMPSSLPLGVPP